MKHNKKHIKCHSDEFIKKKTIVKILKPKRSLRLNMLFSQYRLITGVVINLKDIKIKQ